MVKHMIIWKLKPEFDTDERKAEIKAALESLVGKIDGLISMNILSLTKKKSKKTANIINCGIIFGRK